MVRLKDGQASRGDHVAQFQFLMVRLKGFVCFVAVFRPQFQFLMVRLKA